MELIQVGLFLATLFCSLVAGLVFAFAIVVMPGIKSLGDRDFLPVLQSVRRLGKRVAIASIRGCCAGEYYDPQDQARIRDMDVIWLDD